MRIIIVESDDTERYPPEISVINALVGETSVNICIISLCPSEYITSFCKKNGTPVIGCDGKNLRKKN